MITLYEDPEDNVPKIVVRCDNYMAWITEQKMPLHLHVGKDKEIRFDQVGSNHNIDAYGLTMSSLLVEDHESGRVRLCLPGSWIQLCQT